MTKTVIVAFITACLITFLNAWILQEVWRAIAWEFNLPTFSYWVYCGFLWVMQSIFKASHSK